MTRRPVGSSWAIADLRSQRERNGVVVGGEGEAALRPGSA